MKWLLLIGGLLVLAIIVVLGMNAGPSGQPVRASDGTAMVSYLPQVTSPNPTVVTYLPWVALSDPKRATATTTPPLDPWPTPTATPTLPPGTTPTPTSTPSSSPMPRLFVGLIAQSGVTGDIQPPNEPPFAVGYSLFITGTSLIDAETLQVRIEQSYLAGQNPKNWDPDMVTATYSVKTGRLLSTSASFDPDVKWGYSWLMPFDLNPTDGSTLLVGNQPMTVHGPYSGKTSFGQVVRYWELVNQNPILYFWDGISEWKLWVEPGDATLRYIVDGTRLLMYDQVKRTYYQNDVRTPYYVAYTGQLMATNAPIASQGLAGLGLAAARGPVAPSSANGLGGSFPNQTPVVGDVLDVGEAAELPQIPVR